MISYFYGKILAPILLKRVLKSLGRRGRFAGWVTVHGGKNVSIGNDFFAGPDLYISTSQYSQVTIGDAVMFGPNVTILGGNHDFSYNLGQMRFNQVEDEKAENIMIETGVWVGANSVILSGAAIGEGAVVGAATVVNRSVPPYVIAVGNKMRIIRCRFKKVEELKTALRNCQSEYSLDELLALYSKENIILGDF